MNIMEFTLSNFRSELLLCCSCSSGQGLFILSDLMDQTATACWILALLLPHNISATLLWRSQSCYIHNKFWCGLGTIFGDVLFHNIHSLPGTSASYASHCHIFVYFVQLSQKTLVSFMLSNTSFCALWASTLWAHYSIHSQVASLMSSNAYTSLSISLTMPSLSSPCMNCC